MALPRVKVLVATGGNIGREFLRGIGAWNREHRAWILEPSPEHLDPDGELAHWNGQGLICHASRSGSIDQVLARDLPRIVIGSLMGSRAQRPRGQRYPVIHAPVPDQRIAAQLAVDHLHASGCRHLAFCPHLDGQDFGRRELFTQACEKRGLAVTRWNPPRRGRARAHLLQWLHGLPRRTGIWAANDHLGLILLELARSEGLHVPEDLAILGNDNDELLCETADPQLSSIASPNSATGYQAAACLEALFRKKPAQLQPSPPHRLITRASTERSAHPDATIAALLAHGERMPRSTITNVAKRLGLSRRSLERRCQEELGQTPRAVLGAMRISRAQHLLLTEHATLDAVAQQCGFRSVQRLHEAFRRNVGLTPRAWQKAWMQG